MSPTSLSSRRFCSQGDVAQDLSFQLSWCPRCSLWIRCSLVSVACTHKSVRLLRGLSGRIFITVRSIMPTLRQCKTFSLPTPGDSLIIFWMHNDPAALSILHSLLPLVCPLLPYPCRSELVCSYSASCSASLSLRGAVTPSRCSSSQHRAMMGPFHLHPQARACSLLMQLARPHLSLIEAE